MLLTSFPPPLYYEHPYCGGPDTYLMAIQEERGLSLAVAFPALPGSPPETTSFCGCVTAHFAFPQHAERRDGVPALGAN